MSQPPKHDWIGIVLWAALLLFCGALILRGVISGVCGI
jgi:hypothetical protein